MFDDDGERSSSQLAKQHEMQHTELYRDRVDIIT